MIKYLTGGRPMKRVGFAFVDVVSGNMVFYYQDLFGRKWMAERCWAIFRVPVNGDN